MHQDREFRVDLDSLMMALGRHLYSAPNVALRELISNARDAIIRRERAGAQFSPRIDVYTDPVADVLAVRDNGLGMDADDLEAGVATIAGGATRLQRQASGQKGWADDEDLSGYFGLGFYSSLMLARAVEVTTTTASNGVGLRWTCSGEPLRWRMEPVRVDWDEPGTEVRIYLDADHRTSLSHPAQLEEEICRYAALVEFPIYVSNQPYPVNLLPPWREEGAIDDDYVRFARERGLLADEEEPITIFEITGFGGVEGMLWLTSGGRGDSGPGVELHVRNILVGRFDDCFDEELSIGAGIVNCMHVPVTLSREDVLRGPEYEKLSTCLKSCLVGHIAKLAAERPKAFHEVIAAHGTRLKLHAVKEESTLQAIRSGITVPVGVGRTPMTLDRVAELSRRAGKTIHYMNAPETQAPYASMIERDGLPVVVTTSRVDHALLERLARAERMETARVDTVAEPDSDREEGWGAVERLFAALDSRLQAKATRLSAEDPPLLFIHSNLDAFSELVGEDMQRFGAAMDLDEGLMKIMQEVMDSETAVRPLLLNTAHPTLRGLRSLLDNPSRTQTATAVARSLLGGALLFSEKLPADRRRQALDWIVDGADALMDAPGGGDDVR